MIWQFLESALSVLFSFFLGGGVTFFVSKWKGGLKKERSLEEGVRCLLRGKLIDDHDKFMEKGYCPIYVKEAARRSYEAYHALGGNGIATKLFQDLLNLPESEQAKLSVGDEDGSCGPAL